jgi:CheY-like chemotaxis protein
MARILVVDDDVDARILLYGILADLGHDVLLATDGEVALTLYDQSEPDLVVTDLVMPVLNGVLLIEHLSNLDPDVRIIAISGKGQEHLRRAKEAGVAAALSKPIQRDKLIAEVARILGAPGARPPNYPL